MIQNQKKEVTLQNLDNLSGIDVSGNKKRGTNTKLRDFVWNEC